MNASPDLSSQIENFRALQPDGNGTRNSPIRAVCLTNGDIDHALGLVLLRERDQPLTVYAPDETRDALSWVDNATRGFSPIDWQRIKNGEIECLRHFSTICPRAIVLRNSVAFEFRDHSSDRTVVVAPAVAAITTELRQATDAADVVLFDGTFWSDDELSGVRPGARSAREMNHLPIQDGSLPFLRECRAPRRIYMHINNTNPILMPDSVEARELEQAGIEIGSDGLDIVL